MRHLMSPLDFSVDELDRYSTLRTTLRKTGKSILMPVSAKNSQPVFMNQVHEHV